MDYELAKELKDAGFPKDSGRGFHIPIPDATGDFYKTHAYLPTLEELIEACDSVEGYCRFLLEHIDRSEPGFWYARVLFDRRDYQVPTYISKDGKSPEEAVANLWFVLNKKV